MLRQLVEKAGMVWKYKKELSYYVWLKPKLKANGLGKYIAIHLSLPMHFNFVRQLICFLKEREYKVFVFVTDNMESDLIEIKKEGVTVLNRFILSSLPFRLVITPASGFGKTTFYHPSSFTAHFFHSIVSTHVVYKHRSFYGYDFLFCAGPHHVEEIKALHRINDRPQYIIPYGYEVTDYLISAQQQKERLASDRKTVLFGPSWGEHNSLRKHGLQIIGKLLTTGYRVILRPHPISFTTDDSTINEIKEKFDTHPDFKIDNAVDSTDSMLSADVMISDYSGVAFEYALALLKPVVFMDGFRKQNNEHWKDYLEREGIEVIYRHRIGYILEDLNDLLGKIEQAILQNKDWAQKILEVRKELLFNVGTCTSFAVQSIDKIYKGELEDFEKLSN